MKSKYLNGELWTIYEDLYESNDIFKILGKKCLIKSTGNKPENWIETAEIVSVYNDRRFETVRYLLVKDDKITEQITVSSGIPNFTNIYPHVWMLNRLRKYLESTDSKLILVHNHPSGLPYPSDNDIEVTEYFDQYFMDNNGKNRFLGHFINGNQCCAFIGSDKEYNRWRGIKHGRIISLCDLDPEPYSIKMPNIMGSLGMFNLLNYAKKIQDNCLQQRKKDLILCFYSNASGYITGINSINSNDFWNNQNKINIEIHENAKKSGATSLFLVLNDYEPELFFQISNFCMKTKTIANVIIPHNGNIIQLDEKNRSSSIFHPGERFPLVISDTREIKKKNHIQQKNKQNNYLMSL